MNKNLLQEHEDIYGFKNEYRWLSNFYKLQEPIDLYGCVFYYTENLYLAFKCNKADDFILMASLTPGEAKRFGKRVELNPDFEANKLSIMKQILDIKFRQEYFKRRLLATGNCLIEESTSWKDFFWGCHNGIGENHLGKIIMEIREELKKET
jgi:ribA/ribD-fused uncharacterized protein